jgi:hypothetical protein
MEGSGGGGKLLDDALIIAGYTGFNGRMIDELERMWKEAAVA